MQEDRAISDAELMQFWRDHRNDQEEISSLREQLNLAVGRNEQVLAHLLQASKSEIASLRQQLDACCADRDIAQQSYRHACEVIANKDQQLADEHQTIQMLQESHLKICDELTEAKRLLAVELQRFNTHWQHDPPQVGDTRWEKCVWTQRGSVASNEDPYEEPVDE